MGVMEHLQGAPRLLHTARSRMRPSIVDLEAPLGDYLLLVHLTARHADAGALALFTTLTTFGRTAISPSTSSPSSCSSLPTTPPRHPAKLTYGHQMRVALEGPGSHQERWWAI